ncbi:hypothetical protein [Rhizorhabdus sp. FW153]|uniref:hypothetical protein n=1 Tax=Rhizorhabdus sp. FW153 TaxID=3400216 RepID=UPI003CF34775
MMTLPHRSLIGLILLGIGGLAAVSGWNLNTRHHIATMLNVEKLPQSISVVDCASFGVTDVLERCSFQISADDFPKLLSGYEFQVNQNCDVGKNGFCVNTADAGTAHDYCCGPKLGDNFDIATTYIATPRDAPHGGSLTILTDTEKRRVMIDLYIE